MTPKQGISSLRGVTAVGYLLIVALTGCIVYDSLRQWRELGKQEEKVREVQQLRDEVHEVYIGMADLLLAGGSVISWDSVTYESYHQRRLKLDSMLCRLKDNYPSRRIDSVRALFEDKEKQLGRIMTTLSLQSEINSQIARQVPVIAQKSAQKPQKAKRGGLFGLFGKKQSAPNTAASMLRTLDRDIISRQQDQARHLEEYADSLSQRNVLLNLQLKEFIRQMDRKVLDDLSRREQEVSDIRAHSFLTICVLTGAVFILLVILYIIIYRSTRRVNRYRKETRSLIMQLEKSVSRNQELLDARQRSMLTITHELRAPLTAIKGYADLITEEMDRKEVGRHMRTIRQASDRMVSLLNTLLHFYRLDNGKEQVNPVPFRLQSIAETLEAEFMPQAESKGLALKVAGCPDAVVMGDKERIVQIGGNLLSNAVKFTDRGSISLRTAYSGGDFTLTVRDTGSGMDEEQQKCIFDAFERLPNAATQDGFGLGLTIVRSLVELLGGSVRVRSAKGGGTTFTVCIPLPPAEDLPEEYRPEPSLESRLHISVLAMDNDEVLLTMTRDMFARHGISCDTCDDARSLMEMIRTGNYDLLVLDMKMPVMSGFDVLQLLRMSNVGNSRSIPVIVATASESCRTEELLEAGFAARLRKPFSATELMETVRRCLSGTGFAEKDGPVDFSSLLAYECNKGEMLEKLIQETDKDMRLIAEAAERMDTDALEEWVHHLRSSWTVIRADRPLWELHRAIHGTEISGENVRHAVGKVLAKGDRIIRQAREERRRLWEK